MFSHIDLELTTRNMPQYMSIELFQKYEMTLSTAYEMAIRSKEVVDIISRNLKQNSIWYLLDFIASINILLKSTDQSPIKTLVDIKGKDLNHAMIQQYLNESLSYKNNIFTTLFYVGNNEYQCDTKNLILAEKLYNIIFQIWEEEPQWEYGKIFHFISEKEYSHIPKLNELYKNSDEEDKSAINKLIELNKDKSFNPLYQINIDDAITLQDEYLLNVTDELGQYTMKELYLHYNFIPLYDDYVKLDRLNYKMVSSGNYVFNLAADALSSFKKNHHSRPLLLSVLKADDIVINIPKTEFEAQMKYLRKQYDDVMKKDSFSSLILQSMEIDIQEKAFDIGKNTKKIADMFFVYDHYRLVGLLQDQLQQEYNNNKTVLKNKIKNSSFDLSSQAIHKNNLDELESAYFSKKEYLDNWIVDYVIIELIHYHKKVNIKETSEEIPYDHFLELIENDMVPNQFIYPGWGKSSFPEKIALLIKSIEQGEYKKLLPSFS